MNAIPLKRRPLARLLTVGLIGALLLSGLAIFAGMPAAGLSPNVSEPYPQTPGSSSNMTVVTTVQTNDSVVESGVRQVSVDASGPEFDGDISSVTAQDIEVFVNRSNGGTSNTIQASNILQQNGSQVTAQLSQGLNVQPGDEVVVRVRSFRNPSQPGSHPLAVTLGTNSGQTDGPASVPYQLIPAELNFSDQRVNDNGSQTIRLSAVSPDQGYVAIFAGGDTGPRELVGSGTIEPNYNRQPVTATINIDEGQQLQAVLYYETEGDTIAERQQASFNQSGDARVLNNGQSVTASAFVEIRAPTRTLRSGNEYNESQQLLFTSGEPESSYTVQSVRNDQPLNEIAAFETNSSGYAMVDTTNFTSGNYVVVTEIGNDVVNLDGDGITSTADDSFRVVNQTELQRQSTSQANASADGESGDSSGGGIDSFTLIFGGIFGFFGIGIAIFAYKFRQVA